MGDIFVRLFCPSSYFLTAPFAHLRKISIFSQPQRQLGKKMNPLLPCWKWWKDAGMGLAQLLDKAPLFYYALFRFGITLRLKA